MPEIGIYFSLLQIPFNTFFKILNCCFFFFRYIIIKNIHYLKFRLSRLKLVKPDFVTAVEESIIAGARAGRIKEKITDSRLKIMLEQMSDKDSSASINKNKVTIQRRNYGYDEEDDNDDDLM